jgi:hypothetical protein
MSASFTNMQGLAEHAVMLGPVREPRVHDDAHDVHEPNITRDLAERTAQLIDSGCLSTADANALRAALVDCDPDLPSFF